MEQGKRFERRTRNDWLWKMRNRWRRRKEIRRKKKESMKKEEREIW